MDAEFDTSKLIAPAVKAEAGITLMLRLQARILAQLTDRAYEEVMAEIEEEMHELILDVAELYGIDVSEDE